MCVVFLTPPIATPISLSSKHNEFGRRTNERGRLATVRHASPGRIQNQRYGGGGGGGGGAGWGGGGWEGGATAAGGAGGGGLFILDRGDILKYTGGQTAILKVVLHRMFFQI